MNTLVKDFFQKPFEVLNVSSKDFDKFFVGFDEQFDRLATLLIELKEQINTLETRFSQLEAQFNQTNQ